MVNVWNNLKDLLGIGALDKSNKLDAANYNKLIAGGDVDTEPVQQEAQQPVKRQDTLLMTPDGQVDYAASVKLKQQSTPLSLFDRIRGREVHIDKETIDPKTNEITTERFTDFKPGILNDISAGYKENRTTPISLDNFGQNKGFATRLGEGLGSIARFADSPAGRALIMGGLVGATGGSGLQALAYGAGAGLGNQQNRMKDRLYRDSLTEQMQNSIRNQEGFADLKPEAQQALLADAANRVNSYRGYIGDDTYKQFLTGMQLQDNAAYRNALLKTQMNNQLLTSQLAQQKLNYEMKQDAIKNAQEWEKIKNDREKKNIGRIMPAASATNLSGTQQGINQMATLMEQIPKYAKLGLAGPIGSLRRFNPYDTNAQAFQQYVNTYKQIIGKGLEGGVLRKEDESKYEKIIPRMGDTEEVLMRKAQQLQEMLINKYNTDLEALYNAGYNTGNFNYFTNPQPQTTQDNTKNIINKLKANGYSDSDIAEYLKMKGY